VGSAQHSYTVLLVSANVWQQLAAQGEWFQGGTLNACTRTHPSRWYAWHGHAYSALQVYSCC
jgi:hypothetical protein